MGIRYRLWDIDKGVVVATSFSRTVLGLIKKEYAKHDSRPAMTIIEENFMGLTKEDSYIVETVVQ